MSHTGSSSLERPRLTQADAEQIVAARDTVGEFPRVRVEAGEDWVLRAAADDGTDPERFEPY